LTASGWKSRTASRARSKVVSSAAGIVAEPGMMASASASPERYSDPVSPPGMVETAAAMRCFT
jgi:hypothetical protein